MKDRIDLKFELVFERGYCSVCKKPIVSGQCDMHECILTRGNALGNDVDIMTRYNCVLVHSGKCHQYAHTNEGRIICIQDLLKNEGIGVIEWLTSLVPMFKSSIIEERIRLVTEVLNGQL